MQTQQQIPKEAQQALENAAKAIKKAQDQAAAPTAPQAPLPPIPKGGGRLVIDKQGDRTIITSAALPPELERITKVVTDAGVTVVGLIAAMVILGPVVRMFTRRATRRMELGPGVDQGALQQQLVQLQQSVDAMSVELERISESQRFQDRLLSEKKS